jgi:multidrug efflux pump subunit AcrA (membrane-fusion protein)
VQQAGEGKGTVMVVNDHNVLEQGSVTLGLQTATQVEILSGLKEGQTVVFGEQGQYRPGQIVSPQLTEPSVVE